MDEPKDEEIDNLVNGLIANDYASVSYVKVKKNYPRALYALKSFILDKSGVDPSDEILITALAYNPIPTLFDFFDDQKIFINITGAEDKWEYFINSRTPSYPTRNQATTASFYEAFLELETNKLTK